MDVTHPIDPRRTILPRRTEPTCRYLCVILRMILRMLLRTFVYIIVQQQHACAGRLAWRTNVFSLK